MGGLDKGALILRKPVRGPIDYFEDPLRQKGYRPEHDTRDPEVRKWLLLDGQYLQAAADKKLKGILKEHANYLQRCVAEGVPSRARSEPQSKNHGLVRGHEEEPLQKA